MKVTRIAIKNFRGILDEEIEFNENLNVFIGSNGAGKTTVLEAIIGNLVSITDNFNSPNGKEIKVSDINYGKKYCSIELEFFWKEVSNDEYIQIRYRGALPNQSENRLKKYKKGFDTFIKSLIESITDISVVPIIKFYSANRKFVEYIDDNRERQIYAMPQYETWYGVFHNGVSYSNFARWFLAQETKELRMQRDAGKFDIKNQKIVPVREAIAKALEILEGKEYAIKSDEIARSGNNELIPVLTLQEKETGQKELLDYKSDGEKAIITLVADIAYNLSIAQGEENADFLNGSGVVLIDEIEAHLHPNWQRKIIPLLRKLFPNIQFFITTHSPQVIASVNSENIIVCEDFKFSKIDIKTKGVDSNTLLRYVFDATERPRAYVDLIEKFEHSIETEESPEKIEGIIQEVTKLENRDKGSDISQLVDELELRLEAYKFDLMHEAN
ncbi:MAG: AAA family ATPase [Bacteroidota bacterium]